MPTHKGDGFRPLTFPLNMVNGVEAVTLTGDLDLTARYSNMLALDPGGASRNVDINQADAHLKWRPFWIYNSADAAENLTIRDNADATVVVLGRQESCLVQGDGTTLHLLSQASSDSAITTNGFVLNDSVVGYFGTGSDLGITWNGTKAVVSQAAANSAIDLGVDGAGIDLVLYGDTAGAAATWDQSADSIVLTGAAKIKYQTIADPGTGAAIPVTASGSVAITTAAAETNTLADPTFMGQWLSIFVDTYAVGDRVITAASRINQAANTVITLGAVGDFIKLEAVTIAGALKWQVVANDGAALS